MVPHEFLALKDGQIRLLELLPGTVAEPLKGTLHNVYLSDYRNDEHNSFEALSYVWGSDEKPCGLTTLIGSIPLTEALHTFLLQLRLEDKSRLLWADAICINQDNQPEKESQVPLMSKIFSTARSVLADLGGPTEDLPLAIEVMDRYWRSSIVHGGHKRTFGKDLTKEQVAYFLFLGSEDLQNHDVEPWDQTLSPDSKESLALKHFFEREWFSRLWVVQEFVLAKDVVLYCGPYILDWRHIFAVCVDYKIPGDKSIYNCYSFQDKRGQAGMVTFGFNGYIRCTRLLRQGPDGDSFFEDAKAGRLWRQFGKLCLADLLHWCRGCQCTLDQDRYFALTQLAADFPARGIPELAPDYSIGLEELVRRFGRFLIQQPKGEEMLLRTGLWFNTDEQTPSWLQDFTRSRNVYVDISLRENTHQAAGDTQFKVSMTGEAMDVIQVQGYKVDGIADVASVDLEQITDVVECLATYVEASKDIIDRAADRLGTAYPDMQDRFLAPCMAVCAANNYKKATQDQIVMGFWLLRILSDLPKDSRNWTQAVIELHSLSWYRQETTPAEIQSGVERAIEEMLFPIIQHLRVASTTLGFLGNVPEISVPGDEIWVLQGCRLPVVLRKVAKSLHGYRLVGSCYCYGLMNGESLRKDDFRWNDIEIH